MNSFSEDAKPSSFSNNQNKEITVSFNRANSNKIPFPPVGFCRLSRVDQLSKPEIKALASFNFSFYTILLNLYSDNWKDEFKKANTEAKGLKIPMQVILQFGTEIDAELSAFIEICNTIYPFVEEVIILQQSHDSTPNGLLQQVLGSLREGLHHVKIGVGGYRGIDEIAAKQPDLTDADFLTIPFQTGIDPESSHDKQFNTRQQIEFIRKFKAQTSNKDIYVTPMSLNAGLVNLLHDPSSLFSSDKRVLSYLAASGKAISDFKSLIFSGVNAISFYENGGKNEVYTADHSSYNLEKIRSFPFFYLLREVLEMNNGFIIQPENDRQDEIDAFVFSAGGKIKVILINLSSEQKIVKLEGISAHAKIINHDLVSIKNALLPPEAETVEPGIEIIFHQGKASIELMPYGIALIHEYPNN
jgi:hypothetical protein